MKKHFCCSATQQKTRGLHELEPQLITLVRRNSVSKFGSLMKMVPTPEPDDTNEFFAENFQPKHANETYKI